MRSSSNCAFSPGDKDTFVEGGRASVAGSILRTRHPGWGEVLIPTDLGDVPDYSEPEQKKLGQLTSTAICGNDITGSCFYVTGALAEVAGIWAPVGAVLASATLWLFRWIYTEAVTALPFNGGIYNVLLNTVRSKKVAGFVATLTMLSYIATSVVSALSAGHYLQTIIDPTKTDPLEEGCYVLEVSISLIVLFAVLKIIGISESATVAACMFVFHCLVMLVLAVVTFFSVAVPTTGIPFGTVAHNVRRNVRFHGGSQDVASKIVLGFANAMLGVSGFESSANFVEEQKEGVFPKTLRNMWFAVSLLNITFILECIFAVELEDLMQERDNALAYLGRKAAGRWLEVLVSVDAFMVLAAAILTSYVGVGGLLSRMAGDRCLPNFFQRSGRVTTVLFMLVCISLVLLLEGNSKKLEACYSFAFLTVMLLFALSLFVLQVQRPKLPTAMKNNLLIPAAAAALVLVALGSSVVNSAETIPVFLTYLLVLVFLIGVFMYRLRLLSVLTKTLSLTRLAPRRLIERLDWLHERVQSESSVVYFAKTDNICRLNKAILYIKNNEDTNHCRIVHIYNDETRISQRLVLFCQLLDVIYPSMKIDVVFVRGRFGASLITHLGRTWGISPSLMFMNCPSSTEPGRRLQDLRGVRVIMGHEDEGPEFEPAASMLSDRFSSLPGDEIMSSSPRDVIGALLQSGSARMISSADLARPRAWSSPIQLEHVNSAACQAGGRHELAIDVTALPPNTEAGGVRSWS